MTVLAIVRDLILASRIEEACRSAGVRFNRVDDPPESWPTGTSLALVDWGDRRPGWAHRLIELAERPSAGGEAPRVVLFGPHTDLDAHAAASQAGLGPMWARSRLVRELGSLLAPAHA